MSVKSVLRVEELYCLPLQFKTSASCFNPRSRPTRCVDRAPWRASRVIQDEDLGSHVSLVAEHRSRHRASSKHLQSVSASTTIPSSVTPSAMALAHSSMFINFCRPNRGKDGIDRYWRPLEVDWSSVNDIHNNHSHTRAATNNFCTARISGIHGVRQRSSICIRGIWSVLSTEWYTSCLSSTLSSVINRTHGKSLSNGEAGSTEDEGRKSTTKALSVPFQLQDYTTEYHWSIPCWVANAKTTLVLSELSATKFVSERVKATESTKEGSWQTCSVEIFSRRGGSVCEELWLVWKSVVRWYYCCFVRTSVSHSGTRRWHQSKTSFWIDTRKRHVKTSTTIRDKESALPEDLIPVPEVMLDTSREGTEREVNDEISPLPESIFDSESGAQTPELSIPSPTEVPSAKQYPSRIR